MTKMVTSSIVALTLGITPPGVVSASTSLGRAHGLRAPAGPRVDASTLGSGADPVQQAINADIGSVIEGSSIDPSRITVRLEWLDDTSLSYFIHVTIEPKHDGAEAITQRVDCRNCITQEIAEKAFALLGEQLALAEQADARAEQATAEAEAAEEAEAEEPTTVQLQPQVDRPPSSGTIGVMGWSGVALLVTGALVTATGGAFLGVGERQAANFPTKIRDYQPPGIGLVVGGGVAIITGAVLLGLGIRRARRTHAHLHVAPGRAAFTISGRF